jgi:hypothetical protein
MLQRKACRRSHFSHGSSVADIDGDGDIDIWVNNLGCSSGILSYLLQNDGTFRDETNNRLPSQSTVGVGGFGRSGDIDGDHLADLLVNLSAPDFATEVKGF